MEWENCQRRSMNRRPRPIKAGNPNRLGASSPSVRSGVMMMMMMMMAYGLGL